VDARDLYQLPREEFTAARNELAAEQKKSGDADEAAATKKLPKPSNAAWLVNRAAGEDPAAAESLLDAGASLRDAYESSGSESGRGALRKAIEAERHAVENLMRSAADLAIESRIGGGALDKVRETLHALSSDEELRGAFEAGTVAKERTASGIGGTIAPAPAGSSRGGGRGRTQRNRARERRIREAKDRLASATQELDAARARLKDAEADLTAAADAERAAKRDLRDAESS
jgi:hypothetical protein